MSSNEKDDLDKVREEHLKQIFQLYQDKSKGFQKSFNILCFLALAFLFIILIPYISIKAMRAEIYIRLQDLSAEIARLEPRSKLINSAIGGYNEVHKKLQNGPQDLRRFILSLEQQAQSTVSSVQSPIQHSIQQTIRQTGPCELLAGKERLNCLVTQEVESLFAELQKSISQNFLGPLETLDAKTAASINLGALETGLNALQVTFKNKLASAPNFWETFSGKGEFFLELDGEVDRFWLESGSVIEKQYKKLQEDLTNLQKDKMAFEQQQTKLQAEETQIAERLSKIEFPLGKLPIGLIEAVAVFPLLIAIGFAISVSGLVETLRLRKAFQIFYQQKDPGRTILTDVQIALITPLFIDPTSPFQNRIVRFSVLSIPLVVFLVAAALILYSWTIPDTVTSASMINDWMYGGLYILSLGGFVYSYWQLIIQLRQYTSSVGR
jgi:predicted  nucleic acid-binding Zn-ribbon protein